MSEEMTLTEAITAVVRGKLAERRIEIPAFAEMAGESKSSVYRWLNNEVASLKVEQLDAMARGLGMTADALMALAREYRQQGDGIEARLREHLSQAQRDEIDQIERQTRTRKDSGRRKETGTDQ